MRIDLKIILIFTLLSSCQIAQAECDRVSYEFRAPDKFIKLVSTSAPKPRGTVIISHGGTSGRAGPLSNDWALFLNANGFDAIILNHYPQRGLDSRSCKATLAEASNWRKEDTFAVLKWLDQTNSDASENIVLIGFSAGSAAVFPFLTETQIRLQLPNYKKLKGGIVFYPWANGCMNPPQKLSSNLLFIAGSKDNVHRCWTSNPWFEASSKSGMSVAMIEGAFHAFDNPLMKERVCTNEGRYPYCMEYNSEFHRKSEIVVLEYLANLGI